MVRSFFFFGRLATLARRASFDQNTCGWTQFRCLVTISVTTTQGDQCSQSEDRSMRPLSLSRLMSCLCWWRMEVRRSQKRQREEQNSLLVSSMTLGSSVMGGNQRRKMTVRTPIELLRFFVVRVKPSMKRGPGSNHGNGRVVEQAWLPGVDCQIRQRTSLVSISRRRDQRTGGTFWCQSNHAGSTNI